MYIFIDSFIYISKVEHLQEKEEKKASAMLHDPDFSDSCCPVSLYISTWCAYTGRVCRAPRVTLLSLAHLRVPGRPSKARALRCDRVGQSTLFTLSSETNTCEWHYVKSRNTPEEASSCRRLSGPAYLPSYIWVPLGQDVLLRAFTFDF